MAKLKVLLALLILLWGATSLAQEGSAGSEENGAAAEGDRGADGGGDANQPWKFAAIDTDGNDSLSKDEFGAGLFALVSGAEGELPSEGYLHAVQAFDLNMEQHSFHKTDADGDGLVSLEQEFMSGIAASVFNNWDDDNDDALSSAEYTANMLKTLDADADGTVTAEEFGAYAAWFDRGGEEVAGGGGGGDAEAGVIDESFFLSDDPEVPAVDEEETDQEVGAEGAEGVQGDDGDEALGDDAAGDPAEATDDEGEADGADDADAEGAPEGERGGDVEEESVDEEEEP